MMSPMAGDLRANREGYRRWSRVAWAATGVLWALLFFAGPDQVASNTFIDRRSDGSAAPDSLFQYVAEHHAAVGALLIALALANILFVVFAAHIAYRLAPTAKPRWLPAAAVVVAALGTLPLWFADVSTALIWFATATGTASAGYRWISPAHRCAGPLRKSGPRRLRRPCGLPARAQSDTSWLGEVALLGNRCARRGVRWPGDRGADGRAEWAARVYLSATLDGDHQRYRYLVSLAANESRANLIGRQIRGSTDTRFRKPPTARS